MIPKKKEDDVKFLQYVVRFYGFLGIFPLNNKYVLMFLHMYFLMGLTWILVVQWKFLHLVYLSYTGLTIYITINMCIIMFNLVCCKNAWTHRSLWKLFFIDIEAFDDKMETSQNPTSTIYLKFIFGNIFYLIIQIVSYLQVMNGIKYAIYKSYLYIVSLQMFVTTSALDMIFNMLEKRYEFLRRQTAEVFLCTHMNCTFWNIKQLKDSHFLLTNTNKRVNELFGLRILLLLIIAFINFLGLFQYEILEDVPTGFIGVTQLFSVLAQVGSYWVSMCRINC